jgi:hypothetical protein
VVDPAVVRFAWRKANVLVRADTVAGLQVWASTILHVGKTPHSFAGCFDPDSVTSWLDYAKALVESKEPPRVAGSTVLRSPPLQSCEGGAIVLERQREGTKWDSHSRLYFYGSHGEMWYVEVSRKEAIAFISTMFLQGAASRVSSLASTIGYRNQSEISSAPKVLPNTLDPPLPLAMMRRGLSGEVWLIFLVKPDSTVDSTSIRVLLSDDREFADAAVSAIQQARYAPAVADGTEVPLMTFERFGVSSWGEPAPPGLITGVRDAPLH